MTWKLVRPFADASVGLITGLGLATGASMPTYLGAVVFLVSCFAATTFVVLTIQLESAK